MPALGQGTWGWAEYPDRRAGELAALRMGLDLIFVEEAADAVAPLDLADVGRRTVGEWP